MVPQSIILIMLAAVLLFDGFLSSKKHQPVASTQVQRAYAAAQDSTRDTLRHEQAGLQDQSKSKKVSQRSREKPEGFKEIELIDVGMQDIDFEFEGCPFTIMETGGKVNPFDDNPVYYMVVDNPKYDKFFKDAAVIYGTVLTAREIAEVKKAGVSIPTPMIQFFANSLPPCLEKAKEMAITGQNLISQIKGDYTGLKLKKGVQVTNGVKEALSNINNAIVEIPSLVESFK